MSHSIRSILVAQSLLLLPGLAGAEEDEVVREADREIVRKQTRLDFNESRIDGELTGPEGGYVPGTGRIRFKSLIELRQDFHQELQTSVDSDF